LNADHLNILQLEVLINFVEVWILEKITFLIKAKFSKKVYFKLIRFIPIFQIWLFRFYSGIYRAGIFIPPCNVKKLPKAPFNAKTSRAKNKNNIHLEKKKGGVGLTSKCIIFIL
jgi:hypothetical protein